MKDAKHLILVIDDDPEIRDSLRIILEAYGYAVETAASGRDGLLAYDRDVPDLILLDLMMEEIDSGTDLARSLLAKGNRAPVYMLSSTGDSLNRTIDYAELGLTGVLQKPVEPELLVAILRSNLGS